MAEPEPGESGSVPSVTFSTLPPVWNGTGVLVGAGVGVGEGVAVGVTPGARVAVAVGAATDVAVAVDVDPGRGVDVAGAVVATDVAVCCAGVLVDVDSLVAVGSSPSPPPQATAKASVVSATAINPARRTRENLDMFKPA